MGSNPVTPTKIFCMTVTVEQTHTIETKPATNGDGLEAVAVFEYGGKHGLMDLIQRSVARTLDLRGADQAKTFVEILDNYPDPAERQRKIEEVGGQFDEALVNFVACSMLASRRPKTIIRASSSEGFDGYLPWQTTLDERLKAMADYGLQGLQVVVERFTPDTDNVLTIPTQRKSNGLPDDQELELSA